MNLETKSQRKTNQQFPLQKLLFQLSVTILVLSAWPWELEEWLSWQHCLAQCCKGYGNLVQLFLGANLPLVFKTESYFSISHLVLKWLRLPVQSYRTIPHREEDVSHQINLLYHSFSTLNCFPASHMQNFQDWTLRVLVIQQLMLKDYQVTNVQFFSVHDTSVIKIRPHKFFTQRIFSTHSKGLTYYSCKTP